MKYRSYWRKYKDGWRLLYGPGENFPEDKCLIADFAIWSKQLTEDERSTLESGQRPPLVSRKKLIEWWPMGCANETTNHH